MTNQNKSKKILLLFAILMLGFLIFLSVMLYTALKPRHIPSLFTSDSSKAMRGNIISKDGFHLASTQKLYKAIVDNRNIDPHKRELFIQLFSIYSEMSPKQIRKRLARGKGSVVLSYNISTKQAQQLKSLAFELRRLKVFIPFELASGREILHGLNIIESGESREYPYGTLLTPLIGYPHKVEEDGYTRIHGVKGLEKQYDEELHPSQNGKQYGPRDVNSYMILNKESYTKPAIDGLDVMLTIPVTLQIRIEKMLDARKEKIGAREIMAVVMDSQTGAILSLASSNRFLPKAIKRSDYPSLNTNPIEYSFEPGSVLKPIVFSLLLEKNLVNPYDLVNGHNGRFKMGRKVITDEHKADWLSAENVIVFSSNIGIAQLAQKLSGVDFYQGLIDYGFATKSGIDIPYEKKGSVPSINQLSDKIYKATSSYGYGLRANLVQLLKAYNVFNNSGRMIDPYVVESLVDGHQRVMNMEHEAPIEVITPATAERMKKILKKTVREGTGTAARTAGLEIGGKTGTAHIAERGRYVNKYHTSFIGFANDKKHHYTIGVVVVRPSLAYRFAAQSAAPVFKNIVDLMIDEDYLQPIEGATLPPLKKSH